MKIDTTIGQQYVNDICDNCKTKLTEAMNKLSRLDLLRPKKASQRLLNVLCTECQNRIIRKVRLNHPARQ